MMEIDWQEFEEVLKSCKLLAQEKNKLYGVKNLILFDGLSIVVRMNDKMSRINNIVQMAKSVWQDGEILGMETLNDTILDLINYAVYLYLYGNKKLIK